MGVVLIGTIGYVRLEGLGFLDSLYLTVITLTTTGYGDMVPKTSAGKFYTMFLLLTGMGIITYSISTVVGYITSIDFSKRRRDKMEKEITNLKDHTVVCGFGRMGEIICKKLKEEGVTFVVIERQPELIEQLKNKNYYFIEGDAAQDENLEKASIKTAKVLVSVIDNDADGLYITLAGRSYNPDMQIIARANEQTAKERMLRAGANKVVLPYVMSGLKVAETVINPAVEDFLTITDVNGNGKADFIQLADLHVTNSSTIVGRDLKKIGPALAGIIIVGVRRADQSFTFKPKGDYIFNVGDCIIVLGEQTAYKQALRNFALSNTASKQKKEEAKAA